MSRPCLPGARAAAVLRPQQQPCRLGGADLGAELSAKSPSRQRRAQELDASNDGAKIRVQILKSYLQGHIYEKISKKELKNKKFGSSRNREPGNSLYPFQTHPILYEKKLILSFL